MSVFDVVFSLAIYIGLIALVSYAGYRIGKAIAKKVKNKKNKGGSD